MTMTEYKNISFDQDRILQGTENESECIDQNNTQAIIHIFVPRMQRVVIILTGSFNPVTIGHLHILEFTRDYYQSRSIQVVEGIISPVSDSYGKPGLINVKHRIEMLRAAIGDKSWLRVDTWEAEQPAWTRTKLVLDHHHELVKQRFGTDVGIRFLAGTDVVRSMLNPIVWTTEDINYIMTNYGVACTTRAMTSQTEESSLRDVDITEGMPDLWKEHIDIIPDWLIHNISSTKVRERLREGSSVKYIVPDGVIEIIRKYGLYNSTE